ncbi:MAG: hypothetical protein QOG15_1945 [Solirubrobacteraceae bacterium]|nr:hypothetical protein [Solirubrobacteraceae bacterium]
MVVIAIRPVRRHLLFLLSLATGVLLALPGPASAAPVPHEPRIVGGIQSPRAWPAQGALYIDGSFACGGTLVSGRWFLTAGHCGTNGSDPIPAADLSVRLGNSNRNLATAFGVSAVIVNAGFDAITLTNDLTLLQLSTAPSPGSTTIQPLRLISASETALWSPGTLAAIIGWGTTCSASCGVTTTLKEAGVPITSDSACASDYGSDFIAATMVCAGNGITDTCQGDSGGPIMVPRVDVWVLVGVTSWGNGCADPDFPGIYARLGGSSLNSWVRARIPTVAITSAGLTPPGPAVGSDVTLSATGAAGQHGGPAPAFQWDLDNDGQFDDATGATAHVNPISAGSHPVSVQRSYPDGDRAVAREVVTTDGSPAPSPPDPAPVAGSTPPPSPGPPPAPPPEPPPPPGPAAPFAQLVGPPSTIKVKSLLDRRMTIRVRCAVACIASSTLKLDARASRKLSLTRTNGRAALIASGAAERATAGTLEITIRLSRRTVKRLRHARTGTLTLRVVASGEDGQTERLKAKIKLRR